MTSYREYDRGMHAGIHRHALPADASDCMRKGYQDGLELIGRHDDANKRATRSDLLYIGVMVGSLLLIVLSALVVSARLI